MSSCPHPPQVITEQELVDGNCSCVDATQQPVPVLPTAEALASTSPPTDGTHCTCTGLLFTDLLRQRYPTTTSLLKKLQHVWRVRQVFQFSTNANHFVLRWDAVERLDPMDDAFTFSIKALMRKLCELGHSDKCRNGRRRMVYEHGGGQDEVAM